MVAAGRTDDDHGDDQGGDSPDGRAVDGRVARRQRNQDVVLDAVLAMFAEDMMLPTIEQTAKRSGLSLRSLYRYFADPAELVEAAISRSQETTAELARLPHIGQGPLDRRLDEFVSMRVRLHDALGPMYRATVHNAAANARVRAALTSSRRRLREQFELQFAPELATMPTRARATARAAGDVLTQMDSIDLLRRERNLSAAETRRVLRDGVAALLSPPG